MKILHSTSHSFIQGKIAESIKINKWITQIKKLNPSFQIMVDDSDDDEISFTVVIPRTTQKERQEIFQEVKKLAKI